MLQLSSVLKQALKINFETLNHSIKHDSCTWFVRIEPQNIGPYHKTDWIWRSVSKPQNDYPVAVETKLMESLKATAATAKPQQQRPDVCS
jgi:hypothetical protein